MDKLKPCPFCGGEAHTYTFTNTEAGIIRKCWLVHCSGCGLNHPTSKKCGTEKEAVKWWNKRF